MVIDWELMKTKLENKEITDAEFAQMVLDDTKKTITEIRNDNTRVKEYEKKVDLEIKILKEKADLAYEKKLNRIFEVDKNSRNRLFLGLDKYGNAIHPRYRKNEKKD